jgi:type II secretion system protein C
MIVCKGLIKIKKLTKKINLSTLLYMTILCMLAWSLGKLVVAFLETPAQIIQPAMIVPNTSLSATNDTLSIPLSYLLGRPEALLTKKTVESPELIEKSRLDLKLMGLLKHPLKSVAVIEVRGKAQVFAVGDKIQRDVELIEVGSNFAVISNQDQYEKLELKSAPNVLKNFRSTESAEMTQAQSKKLNLIKEQVKRSPLSILGYVRYQFIYKKGEPAMIKVWPKQEKVLFTTLGFHSGDLLKVVNGHTVDELSSNPALWQKLLSESSLSVVIDRQGVEQSLSVEMP